MLLFLPEAQPFALPRAGQQSTTRVRPHEAGDAQGARQAEAPDEDAAPAPRRLPHVLEHRGRLVGLPQLPGARRPRRLPASWPPRFMAPPPHGLAASWPPHLIASFKAWLAPANITPAPPALVFH
uniref:Uncharacterized protein n=1 Tax=Anas zonorhyncha TaxID=75864 RepID=A0A8B9VEQ8_9AVES